MSKDKLARINDLISDLQDEINQPIWSEDQNEGLIEAQSILGDVKESTQRTDFKYSKTGWNNVNPD